MLAITLNGDRKELAESMTIERLLDILDLPCVGSAVAVNKQVISSSEYDKRVIVDGDRIDIIRALGGG